MKVFKNSRSIFEHIFQCLSQFSFSIEQGHYIDQLQYPNQLTDKVWLNPNWSLFSYHCLKFFEKLTENKDIVRLLKQGLNSIKLVASISNFVNEQEVSRLQNILDSGE